MPDDAGSGSAHEPGTATSACPWCSATLPAADARVCPSCGARLVEETDVDLPGVTAVDPSLLAAAAAPRRVKRTFGSLLVGDEDNEIPPPSEAEMPALARPDADVRREMLLLELAARRTALESEARAIEVEEREALQLDAAASAADAPPTQGEAPTPDPDTPED